MNHMMIKHKQKQKIAQSKKMKNLAATKFFSTLKTKIKSKLLKVRKLLVHCLAIRMSYSYLKETFEWIAFWTVSNYFDDGILSYSKFGSALTKQVIFQDISTCVRALRHLLDHPLVFRETNVQLDKPQNYYDPKVRHTSGPPSNHLLLMICLKGH
jgi:hypothetical protein